MDSEYLDPQQCADILSVKKRTFLERYAPRPDFPARISVSKKRFWWKKEEVVGWLDRQKKTPDDVICTTFAPSGI